MYKFHTDNTQRIQMSNARFGLLEWFHKRGPSFSLPKEEARWIDFRVLIPVCDQGLMCYDGHMISLTPEGRQYLNEYKTKSPFKSNPSDSLSHYIKIMRRSRKALAA
jgi:hypothetical protein